MQTLFSVVIRIPDDMPLYAIVLALLIGVLISYVLVSIIKRRNIHELRRAVRSNNINEKGLQTNTYSKYGILRNGRLCVDPKVVTIQDKHNQNVKKINRSDISAARYKGSGGSNFCIILNLRDGSSECVYTMRPTAAHKNVIMIIQELGAQKS